MGVSDVQNLERFLSRIQTLGVDVEVYLVGRTSISGKISYVGSDFAELEVPEPGGNRKAICPFCSIQYLSAAYETPK